jgi:hypothetical protein
MWIEYRYEDGSAWQGCPDDQTHELKIWSHEKEGFSWCVVTADVHANAPKGWSATLEDAKRHAETAYMEWYGYSCLVGELEVSLQALKEENAMLRDERRIDNEDLSQAYDFARNKGQALERQAVVAWLRAEALEWEETGSGRAACMLAALTFERGEHRRIMEDK